MRRVGRGVSFALDCNGREIEMPTNFKQSCAPLLASSCLEIGRAGEQSTLEMRVLAMAAGRWSLLL